MLLDIDNFKQVNDLFGHSVGDQLIMEIAEVLKAHTHNQFVSRIGGDEFVILFRPYQSNDEINTFIQTIFQRVKKPWTYSNQTFFITMSVGVSNYPHDGHSLIHLLKNSDTALYSAKDSGKDRLHFYTESMNEKNRLFIETVKNLKIACSEDAFSVFFQPLIEVKTLKVISAETLVRWISPEKGLILPQYFIRVAEQTGIINEIDRIVFTKACEQMNLWSKRFKNLENISINISTIRFIHSDLIQELKSTLNTFKIKGDSIILEITETTVMEHFDDERIREIKEMGISLALDDFGTGFSSLTYLKKLPIEYLKMDRDFISDMASKKETEIIIKSIINLAHDLNIKVIAEGVETEEQFKLLEKYNCDFVQGYYFGKPMPAADFENLFLEA